MDPIKYKNEFYLKRKFEMLMLPMRIAQYGIRNGKRYIVITVFIYNKENATGSMPDIYMTINYYNFL